MQINLPNGYCVDFYNETEGVYIVLVNPDNYTVTSRKLTEDEKTKLKNKL